MHQTAYKNALLQLNWKKSFEGQKVDVACSLDTPYRYVWGVGGSHSGFVGDFDLERILYNIC